jgi:hypothetical protein
MISPSQPDLNIKHILAQRKRDRSIGLKGYLKVESQKSEKSGKIPKISGFFCFFKHAPLLSTLIGPAKCHHFSHQGALTKICTAMNRKAEKV